MADDPIPGLIAFLNSTSIVNIQCEREYDPPVVAIALPFGAVLTLKYDTYQQIRQAAGLPDDVCKDNEA